MRLLTITLSLALAGTLGAQAPATIDPGMTRAQVVERLGQPSGARTTGPHEYLFYRNGCERACGMSDLVVLREGAVVDAIFRTSARRYSGNSSSPATAAPMRSPDTEAIATDRAPGASSERRIPAGARGGLVTGNPAGGLVRDPDPTPGMSVRSRPVFVDTTAPAVIERMNPRDSLSPRLGERATHETSTADQQQERGTPPPRQRGLTAAPLSPGGTNAPAPAVTGVRPNPQDSLRLARQRAAQRAGLPVRPDTNMRDTALTRPPLD